MAKKSQAIVQAKPNKLRKVGCNSPIVQSYKLTDGKGMSEKRIWQALEHINNCQKCLEGE